MGEWKKVIVSGSDAELQNITVSTDISASGKWFANLVEAPNQDYVVTYDPTTGEFKYRLLSSFPGIG